MGYQSIATANTVIYSQHSQHSHLQSTQPTQSTQSTESTQILSHIKTCETAGGKRTEPIAGSHFFIMCYLGTGWHVQLVREKQMKICLVFNPHPNKWKTTIKYRFWPNKNCKWGYTLPHLIFVTTITTAGCVKNSVECKKFQLVREKLLWFCTHEMFSFTKSV